MQHIKYTGAIVIKYGSLLTNVPFEPNALLALSMVAAPPLVYAVILAVQSNSADA